MPVSATVAVVLLLCSSISFAGAGAAMALRRHHIVEFGEGEAGFATVATMLILFGALCAGTVSGTAAVVALLVPIATASYAFTAQRLGLFRIVTGDLELARQEETELHT